MRHEEGVAEAYTRCDRCPALPVWRFKHLRDGTDLVFCKHHGQRYEAGLVTQHFTIAGEVRSNVPSE